MPAGPGANDRITGSTIDIAHPDWERLPRTPAFVRSDNAADAGAWSVRLAGRSPMSL